MLYDLTFIFVYFSATYLFDQVFVRQIRIRYTTLLARWKFAKIPRKTKTD